MTRVLTYMLACVCLLSVSCQGLMIGLLPIAAIGLVGLKLYVGMHLLGLGTSMVGRQLPGISLPDQDEEDLTTPTTTTAIPPLDELSPDEGKRKRRAVGRLRVRRGGGLPKLNVEMLQFIHEIDDEQCFEKFFCQLGADRKAFGSFGTNVALFFDFYIPDRTTWYAKALSQGRKLRNKELCPGKCESEDIERAVKYVSKHVFDESR